MAVRKQRDNLWNDVRGDAVVEATILFPIIIMVFAGLVLLAILLGAVYAAVTLLPQILEIADGDPLTWEGHL